MCWWISTHKLKLLVVVLTLIVAVDGELKASMNATLLLYYSKTKFAWFLIARCLLGFTLAIWALIGFFALFYDSVTGVAIYSTGICAITSFDIACIFWEIHLNSEGLPNVLQKSSGSMEIQRRLSKETLKLEQGIANVVMVILVFVQVVVNIAGWWLAMRLRKYHADEEQYERDRANLEEIRNSQFQQ
ncbi:uncharacterized protein LOC111519298 isoform X2 [Drosophila willistoni]|uniref:uncharacterized protein LOC111519298 isoform X2 n=1 Tax=Drosophila willistoni TaxID=7260 RepID=UPI000C26CA90|nr:uncharacterized protein LOC111519298 isoform X2 [Drosophila willistoni]